MTSDRAAYLRSQVTTTLYGLLDTHPQTHLVLGKDYLESIDAAAIKNQARITSVAGGIGIKLQHFSSLLSSFPATPRSNCSPENRERGQRPLYFLPDWDDFLDVEFDFTNDKFSAVNKDERRQAHSIELMKPRRMCDGVLVSLAQHLGSKGFLRRVPLGDQSLLKPKSVKSHFSLFSDQLTFGDCGAFSYANQHDPTISVDQAVAVYDLYEFDMGASVDHIPLPEIVDEKGQSKVLSDYERQRRVKLTKDNANAFIQLWKAKKCRFTPVGVIQGITASSYARQVHEYIEMGYKHIALGGLVPRSDDDIGNVVRYVSKELQSYKDKPWIHLLGVFRPRLQELIRRSDISSFDSATYFRKAWLRSDQNYLAVDGSWYAAIRVPPTSDPRTLIRLKSSGKRESTIKRYEKEALEALRECGLGKLDVDSCLNVVLRYDRLLSRGEFSQTSLRKQYRKTLEDRPWFNCKCNICRAIGINTLIFRGYNRNKRRGAHNTLMLYEQLRAPAVKV